MGIDDKMIQKIVERILSVTQPDKIILFGSAATDQMTRDSDIDLLLVGEAGFSEVVKALYPAQEALGREINPKLYGPSEWQKARAEGSAFVREVLTKPVINVISAP